MAKILDQYGQPIDTGPSTGLRTGPSTGIRTGLLKAQIAGPQQYGVRTIGTVNSFTGLDPARLANILRAAETADPRPFLELAEEMEEKYLHYAAQLATRKRAVCGLEWQVVPASERLRDRKIAELIEGLVPLLEHSLFDILDVLGKGYSITEIDWQNQGATWLPVALERRDPRWFQFDRIDGRTLRLRDIANPVDGLPLTPGKFIVCAGGAKSGLPIRGGLARSAAYAYLFHNFSLRDWVTFCERYGMPLRLGRYHEGALPGDIDILFSAVRGLGADAAAILPKGMEIEFPEIKSASASADLWEKLLAYLDAQVSKLVIGQTLTADSGKGGSGSFALGKVHNEVRIDILRADAKAVCTALNRDLVKIVVDLNFGPQEAYPALRLPVDEPEDMVALAGNLKTLVELGQPVAANWVSDKFAIPLPEEGEAVLGKPAAPANPSPPDPALQRAAHAKSSPLPTAGEGPGERGPTDALATQLASTAQPLVDDLIAGLGNMINTAADLPSLQSALVNAYGDLDTADLARLMEAAFLLAELSGMDAVREESEPSRHTARHAAAPALPPVINISLPMTFAEGMVKVEPAAVNVENKINLPEQATPVVNFTAEVTPPAVNVQVNNDVQPAAVQVHLPARKTETVVMRDAQGQIASATQIETDLTSAAGN